MDIDLKQALGDLADDAPTTYAAPDEIWARGVRRRNRRRGAGAALGALALVAVAAPLTLLPGERPDQPFTAAELGSASLPDRVWSVSGHVPGTDDAGPPGRIAALYWDNGRRSGLFGGPEIGGGWMTVSAVDGRYRYLDAPGLRGVDTEWGPLLSPDGRYVAYAVGGAGYQGQSSTGWRVYDATTGDTAFHPAPEEADLGVGGDGVVWSADSTTLVVDVCVVTESTAGTQSCSGTSSEAWEVGSGRVRELPGGTAAETVGHDGGDLLLQAEGRLTALDPASGERTPRGRLRAAAVAAEVHDGRLTVVAAPQGVPGPVLRVGSVGLPAGGAASTPLEPEWREPLRAAWATPLGVSPSGLALAWAPSERDAGDVVSLDPTGGGSEPVVRLGDAFEGARVSIATDLADGPYRDASTRPEEPRDPRTVVGVAATGAAVLALLGTGLLRRRRAVDA